jgi:hypothetical protein
MVDFVRSTVFCERIQTRLSKERLVVGSAARVRASESVSSCEYADTYVACDTARPRPR